AGLHCRYQFESCLRPDVNPFCQHGLIFIWLQIRLSRKAADLQGLIAFTRDAKDHEAALLNAQSDQEKDKAFVELLNFLEMYAAASNSRLVGGTSKKIIDQKLVDSLATIQNSSNFHDKLEAAISSPETFEKISEFYQKRKVDIQKLSKAMEAQKN
ncbi:hypothetical protein PXK17_21035, partial [Phaeobacter gallaeciensis]